MSIFTLQPIPKSAIKVIDTVPTNDIKPALSPEEEKEMDDETRKLIQQMTSDSSDTDYDKLSDKLSQLSDDELNISMEDLFGLQESIKIILREEVERKYLKPSPNSEKLIYNLLNQLFSGADMDYIKHWNYILEFEFCKNGKKIAEFVMNLENDDDAWDDERVPAERGFNEGSLRMYKDTIDNLLNHYPIRRNYLIHIIEEWFEETYLERIHKEMDRNDITLDSFDILSGGPDVCVPPQTKPDEITDEEMIKYIMKNTLFSKKDIVKNESEEPGWIENLYLKKLSKKITIF
jgi:hypothetical protein